MEYRIIYANPYAKGTEIGYCSTYENTFDMLEKCFKRNTPVKLDDGKIINFNDILVIESL